MVAVPNQRPQKYHDHFLLGEYLSPAHSKCYCPGCVSVRGEPKVKFSGSPQKKYAVAHGWVKFGLRYIVHINVSNSPQSHG